MKANKIFFDLFSTGEMTDYKAFYDRHDIVYIVLVDMGIYTTIKRQEMFDKGLNYGCFIEHRPQLTPDMVVKEALEFVKQIGARYVDNETFIDLEARGNEARTRKAFAIAEKMIRGEYYVER